MSVKLPKRAYYIAGISFFLMGVLFMFNSFQGVTGFAILGEVDLQQGMYVGFWFIMAGLVVMAMTNMLRVTSRIDKDSGLVRLAKQAGRNERVQKEIDHLTYELNKGNTSAGLGTEKLFGNISYMRGRNGGRVFYRNKADGSGYELLAKSSKANEDRVIEKLHEIYDSKKKSA